MKSELKSKLLDRIYKKRAKLIQETQSENKGGITITADRNQDNLIKKPDIPQISKLKSDRKSLLASSRELLSLDETKPLKPCEILEMIKSEKN